MSFIITGVHILKLLPKTYVARRFFAVPHGAGIFLHASVDNCGGKCLTADSGRELLAQKTEYNG